MSLTSGPAGKEPVSFEFTAENKAAAEALIQKYPQGRQASAVMGLLDLAQRQCGNWLPRVAIDYVADYLLMPHIKAYEVATFYSMYNLKPIGKNLVQVCTTTPCWLRGSDEIVNTCKNHLGIDLGQTSVDGLFTLVEVECLAACINAPMVQIGDDYYEDLDQASMVKLLDDLASGVKPQIGSQTRKFGSMAIEGPTTLKQQAETIGLAVKEA